MIYSFIFFTVAPLALAQWYDYPGASEDIIADMGKIEK